MARMRRVQRDRGYADGTGPRAAATLAPPPSEEMLLDAGGGDDLVTDYLPLAQAGGIDGGAGLLEQAGYEGQVEHSTVAAVTLYDQQGNARRIHAQNLRVLLRSGFHTRCPLCRGRHTDMSPNQCPKREPLLYMPCTICGRKVWEERLKHAEAAAPTDDPAYVAPKLPGRASREAQLEKRLEQHMRAFHASEAEALFGIGASKDGR